MNTKSDKLSLDQIVADAFEKMRGLTAAGASYEVDRTSGQLIVRRALRAEENPFPAEVVAHLVGARKR